MSLSRRKEELERALALINQQIDTCDHEYGEIQYDHEIVKVLYGSKLEGQGSDVWFVPEGYSDEKRDCWSQTYKKYSILRNKNLHKIYFTLTCVIICVILLIY